MQRPSNSFLITRQQGKSVIILYYQKLSDEKIDIAINKIIEKKIKDLAYRRLLKSEKFKKLIDKRTKEIFKEFIRNIET